MQLRLANTFLNYQVNVREIYWVSMQEVAKQSNLLGDILPLPVALKPMLDLGLLDT